MLTQQALQTLRQQQLTCRRQRQQVPQCISPGRIHSCCAGGLLGVVAAAVVVDQHGVLRVCCKAQHKQHRGLCRHSSRSSRHYKQHRHRSSHPSNASRSHRPGWRVWWLVRPAQLYCHQHQQQQRQERLGTAQLLTGVLLLVLPMGMLVLVAADMATAAVPHLLQPLPLQRLWSSRQMAG
jgi:hypothetical protein